MSMFEFDEDAFFVSVRRTASPGKWLAEASAGQFAAASVSFRNGFRARSARTSSSSLVLGQLRGASSSRRCSGHVGSRQKTSRR